MTSSKLSVRRRKAMEARHLRRKKAVEVEITKQQQSSAPIVPYASFSRLVREILDDYGDLSIRGSAMQALQTATEDRVTEMFSEAQRLAEYANRDTIIQSDIRFTVPAAERPREIVDIHAYPPPEPDQ